MSQALFTRSRSQAEEWRSSSLPRHAPGIRALALRRGVRSGWAPEGQDPVVSLASIRQFQAISSAFADPGRCSAACRARPSSGRGDLVPGVQQLLSGAGLSRSAQPFAGGQSGDRGTDRRAWLACVRGAAEEGGLRARHG